MGKRPSSCQRDVTESLLRGFWEGFLPWEELSQLLRRKRPGGVPRSTAVGGASASESTWTEPLGDGRGRHSCRSEVEVSPGAGGHRGGRGRFRLRPQKP